MSRFLAVVVAGICALARSAPAGQSGEILYYEESRRGKGNLVTLDLETGDKRPVGESGSRSDHFPSWSADGRSVVFESYRVGGWHVWISSSDGSNARRLSNFPDYRTSHYEFDPSFAPDNRTVVFVHADSLWTVTIDDPSPRPLFGTDNGLFETAPVYSPDGERIAIAGREDRSDEWNIYTLSRDGGELRKLTKDGRSLAPQWSPDGLRILFYSDRDGGLELHEMTREDGEAHPVLSQAQRESAGFHKTPFIDPWDGDWGATEQYRASYSPDGGWIVFSRDVDGDRELFVARRDGTELTRVTRRAGLDAQPAWRRGR